MQGCKEGAVCRGDVGAPCCTSRHMTSSAKRPIVRSDEAPRAVRAIVRGLISGVRYCICSGENDNVIGAAWADDDTVAPLQCEGCAPSTFSDARETSSSDRAVKAFASSRRLPGAAAEASEGGGGLCPGPGLGMLLSANALEAIETWCI